MASLIKTDFFLSYLVLCEIMILKKNNIEGFIEFYTSVISDKNSVFFLDVPELNVNTF